MIDRDQPKINTPIRANVIDQLVRHVNARSRTVDARTLGPNETGGKIPLTLQSDGICTCCHSLQHPIIDKENT